MNGILGVHGVRNHLREATAEHAARVRGSEWSVWLKGQKPSAPDVSMAYYADCLWLGDGHAPNDPLMLSPGAKEMLLQWLEQSLKPVPGTQNPWMMPVRVLLGRLAEQWGLEYDTITDFVCHFFPEVDTYFSVQTRREAARDRVYQALLQDRPRVVVAHSLGSVVAWEALHLPHCPPIEVFVTLGSPLAMPHIVLHKLYPTPAEGVRRPPTVGTWINVADMGDVVAVPAGGVARQFAPDHDHTCSTGVFASHSVRGYLTHDATANEIVHVYRS